MAKRREKQSRVIRIFGVNNMKIEGCQRWKKKWYRDGNNTLKDN